MKNETEFQIRICSDLDYEEMVADICYQGTMIAIVSQEEGVEAMKIEILQPEKGFSSLKLPLDDFEDSLRMAKEMLMKMQKTSD